MKTLSKMVVISGLLIMTSGFGSNAALAAGNSGQTTIVRTYTNVNSFAVLPANGAKPCGGNGWWGFNHTTTAGARMMATLMTAYASGRPVLLTCNGLYGGWSDLTSIYTY